MSTLVMTRPVNRLAAMTDYLIKREEHDRTKRRHYSETLGEHYGVLADGSLLFDSGASYTKAEQAKLKHLDDKTKRDIHNIKNAYSQSHKPPRKET